MPSIESLFKVHSARSLAYADHEAGKVPFVTNGLRDNGVVGFVQPAKADRVFKSQCIVLSAFLEATVQDPPFIARGNGGSGLIVLEPRAPLSRGEMAYLAAFINTTLRWRFSWYRQASAARVCRLDLPDPASFEDLSSPSHFVPEKSQCQQVKAMPPLGSYAIADLYVLDPGEYHVAGDLKSGDIPLIGCGEVDDGIVGFVSVPRENVHSHKLTIALNGSPLVTRFHPYKFAAKDDVAVCTPKHGWRTSTHVFVAAMIERERWRYSYYRKCYLEKLRRFTIQLPSKDGEPDEHAMSALLATTTYWQFVDGRLAETHSPSSISLP